MQYIFSERIQANGDDETGELTCFDITFFFIIPPHKSKKLPNLNLVFKLSQITLEI